MREFFFYVLLYMDVDCTEIFVGKMAEGFMRKFNWSCLINFFINTGKFAQSEVMFYLDIFLRVYLVEGFVVMWKFYFCQRQVLEKISSNVIEVYIILIIELNLYTFCENSLTCRDFRLLFEKFWSWVTHTSKIHQLHLASFTKASSGICLNYGSYETCR